jgi:Ca-activated chloride channel family protein
MTFAAPLVLLALAALPLLAVLYAREQRRRKAAAAAFARPAVQPSVAPRRPRWRRHLPVAVIALALIALVLAAAGPQKTVAVPVERASIMLATDVSGSMTATDVKPTRLAAAKRAAAAFVAKVPKRVNVGVMGFNSAPRVLQSPTTDRTSAYGAIDRLSSSGGTATGEAIATAVGAVRGKPDVSGKRPPGAIVLLSDGASTTGRDAIAAARDAGEKKIPVYTVALGTPSGTITVRKRDGTTETKPVPPDPQALAQIAEASGGKTFTAQTADGLSQVYERLGSQLGHKQVKRQITREFAGGGLLLLLGATAMSLGWFGRLV